MLICFRLLTFNLKQVKILYEVAVVCDFEYGVVTCEYCANFIRNENSKVNNVFELAWGMCKKHCVKKLYDDNICNDFVIDIL